MAQIKTGKVYTKEGLSVVYGNDDVEWSKAGTRDSFIIAGHPQIYSVLKARIPEKFLVSNSEGNYMYCPEVEEFPTGRPVVIFGGQNLGIGHDRLYFVFRVNAQFVTLHEKREDSLTGDHPIKFSSDPTGSIYLQPTQELYVTCGLPHTLNDADYCIVRDFTSNFGLPLINVGDINAPQLWTRALNTVDTILSSLTASSPITLSEPSKSLDGKSVIVFRGTFEQELPRITARTIPMTLHCLEGEVTLIAPERNLINGVKSLVLSEGESVTLCNDGSGVYFSSDTQDLEKLLEFFENKEALKSRLGISSWQRLETSKADLVVGGKYLVLSTIELSFPTESEVGEEIEIACCDKGKFAVKLNEGQRLFYQDMQTADGQGVLVSDSYGARVRIVCFVKNSCYQIIQADGNLELV